MYHWVMSKKQVESILEELRPAIQADGGDVHLVDITTEGVVQVRFEGECLRCPSLGNADTVSYTHQTLPTTIAV